MSTEVFVVILFEHGLTPLEKDEITSLLKIESQDEENINYDDIEEVREI